MGCNGINIIYIHFGDKTLEIQVLQGQIPIRQAPAPMEPTPTHEAAPARVAGHHGLGSTEFKHESGQLNL